MPTTTPVSQRYEIRLKGHLDARWAEWFEGLTITLEEDGNTLLTGPIRPAPAPADVLKTSAGIFLFLTHNHILNHIML